MTGRLTAADLPPYSGPGKHCPKCEHFSIITTWHRRPGLLGRTSRGEEWPCIDSSSRLGQHLCRECEDCGYAWAEACADAAPQPSAVPGTDP